MSDDTPESPQSTPDDPGDVEAPGEPTEIDASGESATNPATRSRIVLGVAAAVVLATLGWVLLKGDPEVAAPTTTTTTTTSTTTTVAGRPAQISEVATVKAELPAINVLSAPPPEWETATPVEVWDAPPVPTSEESLPPRPELPRPDYPIDGRTSTDTGWSFSNPSPFDNPMTFLITETRGQWAKVMIPVRPNSTEGYISLADVTVAEHDYRVELRLAEHRLTVYRGTEIIADTPVVVGKDTTRTPMGRFYVTDKTEQSNPEGFYGPYILPLNAYSEQLDIFDDGVPVIAMHGTNRPELVGQSVSNGCIRMDNAVITQLYNELPLGTPVEIYA